MLGRLLRSVLGAKRAPKPSPVEPEAAIDRSAFLAAFAQSDLEAAHRHALARARAFPHDWSARNDLGVVLLRLGDGAAAERELHAAGALDPDQADVWFNLATLHHRRGDRHGAGAMYRKALALAPRMPDASRNYAMLELSHGAFSPEIWDAFALRRECSGFVPGTPIPGVPVWRGEPLAGSSLYVQGEQGLGDEIQFASCYPDVLATAGRCVIGAETRLLALMRRSFTSATVVDRADVAAASREGPFDFQVPSGDLPRWFRSSSEDFPGGAPYLRPDPALVAAWQARLARTGPRPWVGLSWRGGTDRSGRARRSIDPQALGAALAGTRATFVNLQYGDSSADRQRFAAAAGTGIAHWQDAIDDYDETAALVSALDQVVTVATSVLHLSGAVGQSTLAMLDATPRWCYLAQGERMPWYSSVRIVRQPRPTEWAPVLAVARSTIESLDPVRASAEKTPGSAG